MREAILARHGESDFTARGVVSGDPSDPRGLTGLGREQAQRLGGLLAEIELGLCVTSEFPRAQETADVSLAGRVVPRIVVPELNDFRCGVWEGRAFDDYRVWALAASPTEAPPGGESRAAAATRYAHAFRLLLARPEETLLVVAHGLPIRYALEAREGRDPTPIVEQVPFAEPFSFSARALDDVATRLELWAEAASWNDSRM
jgi:2,3-bisphosphoglycerate-dependent phosphoglycerate mutase